MIKGFFFAAFYYMRDKENKPMHIDEILLEAPKHGYRCWVYTYNVNTCLVPNYTLVGGNCTPWQKHLCQFHREKTGGSKCHRFECKKKKKIKAYFSLFLSLFTLFRSKIGNINYSKRKTINAKKRQTKTLSHCCRIGLFLTLLSQKSGFLQHLPSPQLRVRHPQPRQ